MTNRKTRFLAVIDPTRIEQWSLQKAIDMAQDLADVEVYALLCAYSDMECNDPAELRTTELRRHTVWLNEIIDGLQETSVNIEPVVEWNKDWREAICHAVNDISIDLVIKRASGRPDSLASSDRQLIRDLNSALLLVKHEPSEELRKVLLAVDFNAADDGHTMLNDAIIGLGRRIRGSNEAIELHAVSAYHDSDKFVHPPDVAARLDIDRAQAHVLRGKASEAIPGLANKINADLVIVGNIGRRGLSGLTVGNTSEKILTDIRADVLVLVQEERIQRSAA